MAQWRFPALRVVFLLVIVAGTEALLFGRTSIMQMKLGPAANIAVFDRDSRMAVIYESSPTDVSYMTVTTKFAGGSVEYTSLSHVVEGFEQYIGSEKDWGLAANQIALSPDLQLVWAVYTDTYDFFFVGVSMQNWTAVSITHFKGPRYPLVGWTLFNYPGSAAQHLLMIASGSVVWSLPNGTLAENDDITSLARTYYILGTQLYLLAGFNRDVYGTRVDLMSGNATWGPVFTLDFYVSTFTHCALEVTVGNTTVLAFLTHNNTHHQLMLLDPLDLSLSALTLIGDAPSPLVTGVGDRAGYKEGQSTQCKMLPNTTDVALLFDDRGLSLINVTAALITPIPVHDYSLGYWISADLDTDGNALVSTCNVPRDEDFAASKCELLWFDGLNIGSVMGAELAFHPMRVGPFPVDYYTDPAVAGELGVLNLVTSEFDLSYYAFVVTNMSSPTDVKAWCSVMVSPEQYIEEFELDPVTLAMYVQIGTSIHDADHLLGVIQWDKPDWHSSPSFVLDLGPPDSPLNSFSVVRFTVYNSTIAWCTPRNGYSEVYIFEAPNSGIIIRHNTTVSTYNVGQMLWGANMSVVLGGSWRTIVLDSTLQTVLHDWTAGGYPLLSADLNTLYVLSIAFIHNGQVELMCSYANLSMPNASLVSGSLYVHLEGSAEPSVAIIAHSFMYVVMFDQTQLLARFSLDCQPQDYADTTMPPGLTLPYLDRVYFGSYPVLCPVYLDCGAGYYRNVTSAQCTLCPNNSVSALQDTQACVPCPARTAADSTRTFCMCTAGFYSRPGSDDCENCPVGGVCSGGNSLLPLPGYWRSNDTSSVFYTCPLEFGCNGNDVCAKGYSGPLCAVCERHYALVMSDCLSCTSVRVSVVYWLLAVVVYLAAFLALLFTPQSSFSIVKSFISFAQIVTFPASGPMPKLLRHELAVLARYFSLANLQFLSIISPDCVLGYHLKFPLEALLGALIPLVIVGLLSGLFRLPLGWIWNKLCGRCSRSLSSAYVASSSDPFNESPPAISDRLESYRTSGTALRFILFIVLLCTPSATQQLASCFNCQDVAGIIYLVRDYTVQCYEKMWIAFSVPIALLLGVYAVGVPVGLFILLYRYRDKLDLRFLHASYCDEYYWWDCTEQLRKLVLLLLNTVLAPRAAEFYGPCSLSVSMVALSVHLCVRPYAKKRDFWFQCADLGGVCLFFLWAVLPPGAASTETVAWLYWLFAIGYAAASLFVMLTPLLTWLWAKVRVCCGGKSEHSVGSSELDALIPRKIPSHFQ